MVGSTSFSMIFFTKLRILASSDESVNLQLLRRDVSQLGCAGEGVKVGHEGGHALPSTLHGIEKRLSSRVDRVHCAENVFQLFHH